VAAVLEHSNALNVCNNGELSLCKIIIKFTTKTVYPNLCTLFLSAARF